MNADRYLLDTSAILALMENEDGADRDGSSGTESPRPLVARSPSSERQAEWENTHARLPVSRFGVSPSYRETARLSVGTNAQLPARVKRDGGSEIVLLEPRRIIAVKSAPRPRRSRMCSHTLGKPSWSGLAIFSNGTTAHLPHIQEALALFDAPILKLDAGDPETLARINRPAPEVKLEDILDGLKKVPGCIIQSVLVDGKVSNIQGEAFEAWVAALAAVRPTQVQIYSTDYPVPEAGVEQVLPYVLKRIAGEVEERTGLQVRAYWL